MFKYITDIHSSPETIRKICDKLNISSDASYEEIFAGYFETFEFPIFEITKSMLKDDIKYIAFSDIKLGDNVIINYMPFSQKYIEYYDEQKVYGKVFFIDNDANDVLMYHDTKDGETITRHITSAERLFCSYYGDTRGYDYCVYLLNAD